MSNYKTVFFTLGILQIILGIFMLIPIIVQYFYNEIDYIQFSSLGDSIDFGDLHRNKGYMTSTTSDSHGGLGGF